VFGDAPFQALVMTLTCPEEGAHADSSSGSLGLGISI
jgi:hypothetical protein